MDVFINPPSPKRITKKAFMGEVVQDYSKNSNKKMGNFFVKDEKISAQELKESIELIEK